LPGEKLCATVALNMMKTKTLSIKSLTIGRGKLQVLWGGMAIDDTE
jgi:hypothetical protein